MSENGTSADHSSVSMGHTELSKVSRTGFLSIVVPCYNEEEGLAELMWEQAIIANPEPNATFFTLYEILDLLGWIY